MTDDKTINERAESIAAQLNRAVLENSVRYNLDSIMLQMNELWDLVFRKKGEVR